MLKNISIIQSAIILLVRNPISSIRRLIPCIRHEHLYPLFIVLCTWLAYQQILGFPFIEYDTTEYVTNNRYVVEGLTVEGIQWAFFSSYFANWHPITWLSHMLDVEVFGLSASLHHMTSLLLHICNSLLLFSFLNRSTKKIHQSGLVAGIFALHPLHVESVVWIAERKDVLSTFFALLTLISYAKYSATRNKGSYCLAFLYFSLGLMAKPMLVTLPALFIVLDYWPLNRLQSIPGKGVKRPWILPPIILEKLPFFILSTVVCIITLQVQNVEQNIASLESIPLYARLTEASVAYTQYILKALWPLHLAVLYPAKQHDIVWHFVPSFITLLGITAAAIRFRSSNPWYLAGWLWYIGTLVPVIGLIPIGEHDIADRYTYIPLIGLSIMLAYGLGNYVSSLRQSKPFVVGIGAVLTLLSLLTWQQVSHWQSTIILYRHALANTSNNWVMHNNLGYELMKDGAYDEALTHFHQALQINPKAVSAMANLALTKIHQGYVDDAVVLFKQTLEQAPNFTYAQEGFAATLAMLRKKDQSKYQQLLKTIQTESHYRAVYTKLAETLMALGEVGESCEIIGDILEKHKDNQSLAPPLLQLCASQEKTGHITSEGDSE